MTNRPFYVDLSKKLLALLIDQKDIFFLALIIADS